MTLSKYLSTTLQYNQELCNGCRMCSIVCPHDVFEQDGRVAQLINSEACMECGACQRNCPTGAITVNAGVGCATALMLAALTGKKKATCGGGNEKETPCCTTDK
ncbi:ferredoxin family protein [Candidatus Aerophobetes bacterium]|uniref:Ferredoxin family protein n=1 Tax=Aerophobetes bacterium TaxID=2030807 RepID=A0A523S0Y1_UNCAE|nr:MAG: ferredoxin family protein [Candidatus Aerophobetes bacterium]